MASFYNRDEITTEKNSYISEQYIYHILISVMTLYIMLFLAYVLS